jgi:hypothetical protein
MYLLRLSYISSSYDSSLHSILFLANLKDFFICNPFSAITVSRLFEVGFRFAISKPLIDFIGTLDGLLLQVTN